jgi:hypothetical protein
MGDLLSNEKLILLFVFVFPGLVSMHVYRLIMPARSIDWSSAILEGVFYSIINFCLTLPILIGITWNNFPRTHPFWFAIGLMSVLIVFPIIWPRAWTALIRNKTLMKGLQMPHPTAWDWFFDSHRPVFMLIHLRSGKKIGAYYGTGSFASSYPLDGDLYVRAVYELDANLHFKSPIPYTRGLLVRKDEYSHIELFDVPPQKQPQTPTGGIHDRGENKASQAR